MDCPASFTVKPILESSVGRDIAADQEIHDVTGMLEVVSPFEIELQTDRAFRQTQHRARNGQLQFIALHAKFHRRDLPPFPTAVVFFEIRDALAATDLPGAQTIMPWTRVKFDETGQNNDCTPVLLQRKGPGYVTIFPAQYAAAPMVWPGLK